MSERSLAINNLAVMDRKRFTFANEFFRKSIHMLIGFVPFLASKHLNFTIYAVVLALFLYSLNEYLHFTGKRNFLLISWVTELASRDRDKGHFVLGPLTLFTGVLISLLVFSPPYSTLAIYALAFGDGLASLVGKVWGKTVLPFFNGKTLEGSLACFVAVYLASFYVLHDFLKALIIAVFATLLEAVPLRDFDNIIIPIGTGLFSIFLLGAM
jgi:phytol kinase